MASAKESLLARVEQLSEDEAARVLRLLHEMGTTNGGNQLLDNLRKDPKFRLPAHSYPRFRTFIPIRGTGDPASKILADGRR